MLKETYSTIRKQLAKEGVFKINNFYGTLTVLAELSCFAIGLTFLLQVPHFSPLYWILQILLGICLFHFFAILHDCGHKSLFRQKYLNTIVGFAASPFCLIPYLPWKKIHNEHHKWVGVIDKDPTQAYLLKLKDSESDQNLLRVVWKTWVPIGTIKFMITVFWMYPFRELKKKNYADAKEGFISLAIAILPHILLVAYFGSLEYLTIFVPMYLVFYMWIENINLLQHSGLFPYLSDTHPDPIPYAQQDSVTRSTKLGSLFAVLLTYNFNLHIEHHLFPFVAWYNLPKVKEAIQGASDLKYDETTVPKSMLEMRNRDPVDIYVKTLPSYSKNEEEQRDFVNSDLSSQLST